MVRRAKCGWTLSKREPLAGTLPSFEEGPFRKSANGAGAANHHFLDATRSKGGRQLNQARLLFRLAAWLTLGWAGIAFAQNAYPPPGPDVLATPTLTMLDPEFNTRKKQLTWVDVASGDIWVASYDYTTGSFIPADGRGVLIEAAVSVAGQYPGLGFTVNGPEWSLGTPTDYVVYTRTNATGDPNPQNSLVGLAYQNSDGLWTRKSLGTPKLNGPYGSTNPNSAAKISYQDSRGTHYVRTISDPSTAVALPGTRAAGLTPVARFANTANVVAYEVEINGIKQSVAYNLDTKRMTQLTFDAAPKDQSWLFGVPEFGGALGLVTIVGKTAISLYAPVADANGTVTYQVYETVTAPDGGQWFSLEPFAYQGHSYMLAQYTQAGSTYPTSVWLGNFDRANPMLRQLTPIGPANMARGDAEIVPISTGVMIVYSMFDTSKCPPRSPSTWVCMQGLQGLFRADTGLPPPQ